MILATVVWMLVAGVGALLASRLLDTSYGGALAQSVGMLTGTALLLVVMGRWGWLRAGGLLAAVSVQALMFGLLHIMQVAGGNPLDDALMTILNALVGGLLLGALVLLGGSIWPAVLERTHTR